MGGEEGERLLERFREALLGFHESSDMIEEGRHCLGAWSSIMYYGIGMICVFMGTIRVPKIRYSFDMKMAGRHICGPAKKIMR